MKSELDPSMLPFLENDGKRFLAVHRRHMGFKSHLRQPDADYLKQPHWQEKVNGSGVALSRYLTLRNNRLIEIGEKTMAAWHDCSRNGHQIYDQDEPLWGEMIDYKNLLNRCIEDWGLYVNYRNEVFIDYLEHYARYNFDYTNQGFLLEEVIQMIIEQRLQFDWARFEPMNYQDTALDILTFSALSPANRARQRLLQHRQTKQTNFRSFNRKLRQADCLQFNQVMAYYEGQKLNAPVEVDSDYLRDLLRFESLFLVEGDPLADWDPALLAGVEVD